MLQEDIDDIDKFSDKEIDKIIREMSLESDAQLCPHCILFNGKLKNKNDINESLSELRQFLNEKCSSKCSYMLRHGNCGELESRYKKNKTLLMVYFNYDTICSLQYIIKIFNEFIVPLKSQLLEKQKYN